MPSMNSYRDIKTPYSLDNRWVGMGLQQAELPDSSSFIPEVAVGYVQKFRASTTQGGWMKAKKSGLLPQNPYRYQSTIETGVTGFVTARRYVSAWDDWSKPPIIGRGYNEIIRKGGGNGLFPFTIPPSPSFPSPYDIGRADALARSQLLEKIKNQKINAAQFWAERKQVIRMIGQTSSQIAQSYLALKAGNIVAAGKHLAGLPPSRNLRRDFRRGGPDAASRAWLQMQYGWIPLLQDVKGAVEALQTKFSDMTLVRSEGRGSTSVPYKETFVGPWGSTCTVESKVEVFIKYTSFHRIIMAATQMSTALGLQNPAVLAWELLPYSFVVDWFLPIGNYLSSLDATAGVSFSTGSKTTTIRSRKVVTWVMNHSMAFEPAYNGQWRYSGTVTYVKESVDIRREPISSFPAPSFPVPKNPISTTHTLNALALLISAFRK